MAARPLRRALSDHLDNMNHFIDVVQPGQDRVIKCGDHTFAFTTLGANQPTNQTHLDRTLGFVIQASENMSSRDTQHIDGLMNACYQLFDFTTVNNMVTRVRGNVHGVVNGTGSMPSVEISMMRSIEYLANTVRLHDAARELTVITVHIFGRDPLLHAMHQIDPARY